MGSGTVTIKFGFFLKYRPGFILSNLWGFLGMGEGNTQLVIRKFMFKNVCTLHLSVASHILLKRKIMWQLIKVDWVKASKSEQARRNVSESCVTDTQLGTCVQQSLTYSKSWWVWLWGKGSEEGPVLSVTRTRRQLGAICHATLLSIIGVL
jgi:hypothetical protein